MTMIKVIVTCPFCDAEHSVIVYKEDYDAYVNGKLAQKAFPYLSSADREKIISGMCEDCQKKIFGN